MLWHVREGMYGLMAAVRPPGVSLISEDICVRPARVAEAAKDLQALLTKHGFLPGVAGHASAGNLHFLLTPDFAKQADVERYDAFIRELVDLIIDEYDGSLKAEHGTGINMAPFVRARVGSQGDRADVADQAARRPGRDPRPRDRAQPRPGRPPAHAEDRPRDRGSGDQVHRVRLLRADLPVAQRDHHAAPADRAAPRDGPPAGRARRCSQALLDAVRIRRDRDLRGRRVVRRRVPGRDRHRQARQAAARTRARRPRGARRARRRQALRGRGARRAWCAEGRWRRGAARRRSGGRAAPAGGSARCRRRPRAGLDGRCAGRRRRSRLPPSMAGARRGGLPALVPEPDLRQRRAERPRPRRCPRRWWRSRLAPGCRCGFPTTSPGTAAACRGARRGIAPGHDHMAAQYRRRAAALERRRPAPGRDRRELVHARRA